MKTIKKLAFLCSVALAGVFNLTSCTFHEVDINYETERGVVKTEFTISIPAKPSGTRMSDEIVQASEALAGFRGIQDIKLYSFKAKAETINGTTQIMGSSKIDLTGGTIAQQGASGTTANTIAKTEALNPNNYSHLYKDIEVPINTQAFMFYGEAIKNYGDATPTTSDLIANGTLSDNLATASTLGDITFSPVSIYSSADVDVSGNGAKIADYLTSIATATGWSTSENVVLKTLYNNFITMKAGSWASVKGAVQQLYTSIYSRTDDVSTAIKTAILADSNVTDGSPDGTLEFTGDAYGNYPADISLPDGSAYVNWNGSAFSAINSGYVGSVLAAGTSLDGYYTLDGAAYTACASGTTADGTTTYYKKVSDNSGLDIPNLKKYVYPAPLYYRALSNIKTANVSKADVYSSAATWSDVLTSYGTDDVVKASTRSIAIVDQVQYAVGRLDAIIYTDNGVTTLKDNEESDIPIKDGTAYYFPITGILIGGQKAVDYKFEQITTGEAFTIYDNAIEDIYMKESESNTPTHTLCFETEEATSADDPNCVTKISVEFRNDSGRLFVGKDGEIIYPGSKFYLVGTFDPFQNTTDKYTGTEDLIKKTFVQDYTTTAKLKIASLKSAYNTVPDLRAPQLELGLSVDITWQTGIAQTIHIE